jgi:hypothetical protein
MLGSDIISHLKTLKAVMAHSMEDVLLENVKKKNLKISKFSYLFFS